MRISCTTIECYRLWREEDWMPEADLIASIKGEVAKKPAMELGQAYGRVLEHPEQYAVEGGYAFGSYRFARDVVQPALDVIDRRGVFEAKATKAYGPHVVVAKADHLYGVDLSEFKTTLSNYDADKYLDSYQWRFMVDIFQPARVTYHTFCLIEDSVGVISLRGVETLRMYPYAELHRDCCALLADFVAYVEMRNLTKHLTPFPLGGPAFEDSATREASRA